MKKLGQYVLNAAGSAPIRCATNLYCSCVYTYTHVYFLCFPDYCGALLIYRPALSGPAIVCIMTKVFLLAVLSGRKLSQRWPSMRPVAQLLGNTTSMEVD